MQTNIDGQRHLLCASRGQLDVPRVRLVRLIRICLLLCLCLCERVASGCGLFHLGFSHPHCLHIYLQVRFTSSQLYLAVKLAGKTQRCCKYQSHKYKYKYKYKYFKMVLEYYSSTSTNEAQA